MASLPEMSDLELRRKLSDLGFNVGPITDTTRVLYRKRLLGLQEQTGTESPKKSQGQKRKAKTSPSSSSGHLAAVETPTKRPRRGSVLPSTITCTPEVKPVELTEPKTLDTPTKIPTPIRSTRRGRPRRVIPLDPEPSQSIQPSTLTGTTHLDVPTLSKARATHVDVPTSSKALATHLDVPTSSKARATQFGVPTSTIAQATQLDEQSMYTFSSTDMSQVFLAAAQVLQQNAGNSPSPVQEYNSRILHHSSDATVPQGEGVSKNSPICSRRAIFEKAVFPMHTPVKSRFPDEAKTTGTHSGNAEEPLLRNVFPDAHKFIEEAWYSSNREKKMQAVLHNYPQPDSVMELTAVIDPVLVNLAATRSVDLEAMDQSLCYAQVALQNAARPIYKLIHECLNGVLKKKLVKDCVSDSLAFVSHAYETLGEERLRLRQQC